MNTSTHPALQISSFNRARHFVIGLNDITKLHLGQIVLTGEKIKNLAPAIQAKLYKKVEDELHADKQADRIIVVELRNIIGTSEPFVYFYSIKMDVYTHPNAKDGTYRVGPKGFSAELQHIKQESDLPNFYIEHTPDIMEKKHGIRALVEKIFQKKS